MCVSCDVMQDVWKVLEAHTQLRVGEIPTSDAFAAATNTGVNLIASMAHGIRDLDDRHAFLVDVVRQIEAMAMNADARNRAAREAV